MLFPPTRWSLVRRASLGQAALGEWIGFYWYPLYAWSRRRGSSAEDAADDVQSFLEKLCTRNLLAQADESRGKLRSWLLASFTNHIASGHTKSSRLKRGADSEHVDIDWSGVESAFLVDACDETLPDRVYARTWAITLLDEALEYVGKHYESTGRSALFDALVPALESPLQDGTYAELAVRLNMTGAALRKASIRLRERYRRALLEIASVRLGITGEEQLHEEIQTLLGR